MALTSHPAAPHAPRDDLADLKPKQRAILDEAAADHPPKYRMLLYMLLSSNNWDREVVEDKVEVWRKYMDAAVSDTTVAPFVGREPDGVPKACAVLLEDGRGGVARDKRGFPVCVTFGVAPELDVQTAVRCSVWMAHRVARHCGPDEIPQATTVVDLTCRAHHDASRRLPPPHAELIALADVMPNAWTKTYVCGATPAVRAAYEAFRKLPLMRRYVDSIVFCSSYADLREVLPPESMLPWWASDATFDFDLDAYAATLARDGA